MSMKILSPAGDFESLKMAVYNGADEVYLGVKDFNARNIEGFSIETLKPAVDFAHIYGVRVFLAVNILFSDEEIQKALDLIVDSYNIGVDAFIVQDIGLISLVKKLYPQIELHISTQLGVHNLEGAKYVEGLGAKRVVLARETSLEEIKRIRKNTNLEIEYFAHGALCVSFSGNCYISSYLNDASGNRGKCKQLCRLPYDFYLENNKLASGYLLSAKDFNMLDRLKDLEDAGVDSLKIEGRARRPYYVAETTKAYKQALNGEYYNNTNISLAFNRGFTEGYFNGNAEIISNKQNHIGIEIGEVKKFKKGERFNEIYILSNYNITPKSTLKFFSNGKESATISAYDVSKQGELYRVTTTQNVKVKDKVNLISDYFLEQETLKDIKKVEVEILLKVLPGQEIEATVNCGKEIVIKGGDLSKAKNQPLTLLDLETCFNKSELFKPNLKVELGEVFIPKSELNEFRRKVYDACYNSLIDTNRDKLNKTIIKAIGSTIEELSGYQIVENLKEKFDAKNIIYSPEEYVLEDIVEFVKLCKNQNKTPLLDTPNFATEKDIKILSEIVEKTKITIVANNVYALSFNTNKVIGGGLNIYNKYAAEFYGLPYLKAEQSEFKMPYMTLKHCPIKNLLNGNCANCKFKKGYYYAMQNGKKLKLKRKKISECTFYLTD